MQTPSNHRASYGDHFLLFNIRELQRAFEECQISVGILCAGDRKSLADFDCPGEGASTLRRAARALTAAKAADWQSGERVDQRINQARIILMQRKGNFRIG